MQKIAMKLALNTGNTIPAIGFGTYQIKGDGCYHAVIEALKCGYTHIDSASVYRNQQPIAKALKQLGVQRQSLYITSKIGPMQMGYQNTKAACDQILKKLNMEYLDLLLVHWPALGGIDPADKNQPNHRLETWKALIELQKEKKVRDIGVSNFLVHHLQHLIKQTGVTPAVNQFELHPWLYNQQLIEYCRKNHIVIQAYSPLARSEPGLIKNELLQKIAHKYGKSVQQVLIRWSIQNQFVCLPKSQTKQRIIQNYNVFDFELTQQEINQLKSLNKNHHTCWDPSIVIN